MNDVPAIPINELAKQAALLATIHYHNGNDDILEELNAIVKLIRDQGYHIHLKPYGLKSHPRMHIAVWKKGVPERFFLDWREAVAENLDSPNAHAAKELLSQMGFSISMTNMQREIKAATYSIYAALAQLTYEFGPSCETHRIFIKKPDSSLQETPETDLAKIFDPREIEFFKLLHIG